MLRVWPNSAHKINKLKSICYCPDRTRETGLQLRPNEINSNRESRMQTRNKWILNDLTSPPRWAAVAGGGEGKTAPRKNRGGAQGQMIGRGLADL
jgi:hypothetical protein